MAYIYKITNNINNKIYIGQTIRTIKARWTQHCYQANNGSNSHLHCAMRLYGIENFTIEEIESCSMEQRYERETYYIKAYNSIEPNGYNWILAQDGPNFTMLELLYADWEDGNSVIAIANKYHVDPKRVSKLLQGAGVSQEDIMDRRAISVGKRFSKKVIQYTIDGEFINSFMSASEAGRQLNMNRASISRCAIGGQLTYNNFIWQYENDDNVEEVVELIRNKSKSGKNKKTISQYTLDGKFIKTYESASAAGRAFGKAHTGIANAARRGATAYGYRWKYDESEE